MPATGVVDRLAAEQRQEGAVHDAIREGPTAVLINDRELPSTPMIHAISGFHQDNGGDWVAELNCLHGQHMRHRPPFQDRPWVTNPTARQAHVGSSIDCPLCDRAETPDQLVLLRTAGPWDEQSLPNALRHSHRTGEGVWAILKVTEGELDFRMETSPLLELRLVAGTQQSIPPGVPHEIVLIGPIRLTVEF